MITVIMGRTGTGKTTLAQLLEGSGLKVVKSYTTRPRRTPDEDTYHFITPEEAERVEDKLVPTVINGYEYFMTKEELEASDVVVADTVGFEGICKALPDQTVHVLYVTADAMERKVHAVKRAENKMAEEEVFLSRDASEDEQFTKFEELLASNRIPLPNCTCIMTYQNQFKESDITAFATALADSIRDHGYMKAILGECLELDVFRKAEDTGDALVSILADEGGLKTVAMSLDMLADKVLNDDKSPIRDLLMSYVRVSERFKDLRND